MEELIGFHVAFGKTVPDISLNAVANLGYAECRFHVGGPLEHPADPVTVIRINRTRTAKSGVVYVRSVATNQRDEVAIEWPAG